MKITKKELREVIKEVAEEMGLFEGLTAAQEKLPEPLKKAILKKQESDGASDDDSDEESIEEGNAFGAAVKNARDNGEKEFEVGGKKYKLKEKKEITEQEDTEEFTGEEDEDDVEEGNAFGAAVTKAKEDGDTEFEVDGKTYKVSEDWKRITLAEKLDRMLGNRKVL